MYAKLKTFAKLNAPDTNHNIYKYRERERERE
jgi:hypothetical protein